MCVKNFYTTRILLQNLGCVWKFLHTSNFTAKFRLRVWKFLHNWNFNAKVWVVCVKILTQLKFYYKKFYVWKCLLPKFCGRNLSCACSDFYTTKILDQSFGCARALGHVMEVHMAGCNYSIDYSPWNLQNERNLRNFSISCKERKWFFKTSYYINLW